MLSTTVSQTKFCCCFLMYIKVAAASHDVEVEGLKLRASSDNQCTIHMYTACSSHVPGQKSLCWEWYCKWVWTTIVRCSSKGAMTFQRVFQLFTYLEAMMPLQNMTKEEELIMESREPPKIPVLQSQPPKALWFFKVSPLNMDLEQGQNIFRLI